MHAAIRSVKANMYASLFNMGGLLVRQPFPTSKWEQIDPFLLLHHGKMKLPDGTDPKHAGVGPHPHRGFSPVTFVFNGKVHHRDSRGNSAVVRAGGVQWINAGMGIIHSERPVVEPEDADQELEIIQLWVNTPAAHKMDVPEYFPLQAEEMPTVFSADQKVMFRVASGQCLGSTGPIPTASPVNAAAFTAEAGGRCTIPIPEDHECVLYFLSGAAQIEGYGPAEALHAIWFHRDGTEILLNFTSDTKGLLLSGKPLNEPMVSHGPFVMNTETQILQAMRDYQMGKMGVLIEE